MAEQQLTFEFEKSLVVPPDEAQLPMLLCSSPFFKPIADRKTADTQGFEDSDGESFRFGDFEMLRFGPGLDTYDFETLAALYQIINTKTSMPKELFKSVQSVIVDGSSRRLPRFEDLDIDVDQDYNGRMNLEFQFDLTNATQINRYLGRHTDSDNLNDCRKSVARLANNACDLINHENGLRHTRVPFFHLQSNKKGAFLIYFPIQMQSLFKVLLDFDLTIYRKLPPVGQAMMLWMSATSGDQKLTLDQARLKSNYRRPLSDFKRDLIKGKPTRGTLPVLEIMEDVGFINSWEVTGTGRKTPFMLSYNR